MGIIDALSVMELREETHQLKKILLKRPSRDITNTKKIND
jgi:hypothetical protein